MNEVNPIVRERFLKIYEAISIWIEENNKNLNLINVKEIVKLIESGILKDHQILELVKKSFQNKKVKK